MNETWLAHSDLFNEHWIIETKPWVRSLGWFEDFSEMVKSSKGWVQLGDYELTPMDYVNIVDAVDAEKKLYQYRDGDWAHIEIPLVFVVTQGENQIIVGWAGSKETLEKWKKESENPWDWPEKVVAECVPLVALHMTDSDMVRKTDKPPIPVFFASNGESNADENWEHLVKMVPWAMRMDNIYPRRKMFHRCVDLCSEHDQFFVVTGKNFVTDRSVFNFPVSDFRGKHVVFQAKNMSNRLEYGHMGVVCYDKELVLSTPENFGLDFTGYSPTELIPRTVSEARFATTPFEAWRTAFRECVKLTLNYDTNSKKWLDRWLAFAEGDHSDWVLKGAEDGHAFAEAHREDRTMLRKSENWEWLSDYYMEKYDN